MSSPRIAIVLLSAILALGCGAHCLALATTLDAGHACCPGDNDDSQVSAEADCEPAGTTFVLETELSTGEIAAVESPSEAFSPLFVEAPARPPDLLRQSSVLRL